MPKDTSIKKILVVGAGPIIIGQGCEFDYSGTQACKALREEGYEVILVNSNPATIMTDPEFAERTYIEPITPAVIEKIIIKEKPDALLPTLGGQTALNAAMDLFKAGTLDKHGVKMIGANADAIDKGEDRQRFKDAMIKIGLDLPRSGVAHTAEEARGQAIGGRSGQRRCLGGNQRGQCLDLTADSRPQLAKVLRGGPQKRLGFQHRRDKFVEIPRNVGPHRAGTGPSLQAELLFVHLFVGREAAEMLLTRQRPIKGRPKAEDVGPCFGPPT